MSDWEVGYLIAELNSGRYFKKELEPLDVVAVGVDKKPVTTMGGLKILPAISIDECILRSTDILVLPGGNTWLEAIHEPILNKVSKSIKEGIVVAAICGATVGLAKMGLLDSRRHTSNNLGWFFFSWGVNEFLFIGGLAFGIGLIIVCETVLFTKIVLFIYDSPLL